MENQIIQINLVPNMSTPAVVRVSQYDVGRPLVFKVYDGTSPADLTGVTAVVEGTKKSGLGFSESGTVTDNTVTLNTTLAMTQEDGSIPAEIRFSKTGEDVGTANFILAVEKTPHLEGTTDGTTETMADLQSQLDALDTRVDALEAGGGGSGLTDDIKTALLQIAQKVAYIDAHGQDYYDDLYDALYNDTTRSVLLVLSHVSSSNTQSTVEVGDSYTTTLTASTNYTLNSVTVTMGGVDITSTAYSSGTVSIPSVTGNVVITATAVLAAQSITATYTQSGTVYDTDSLDSLKADLVVTANYAGGTSETVPASNYTLSGTLAVGTSTITVTYAGLTDTFSVTVTSFRHPLKDGVYDTSNGQYRFTITNGYHCKAEVIRSSSATTNFVMFNCHTGEYSVSNSDSINNLPPIFTLPAGDNVTLKLKNVVNNGNGGQYVEFIALLRNANATTSYIATTQSTHRTDQTVTATPSSDTGIGAVGFGVNGKTYSQGAYVEFDLELIVGNDIYIGDAT